MMEVPPGLCALASCQIAIRLHMLLLAFAFRPRLQPRSKGTHGCGVSSKSINNLPAGASTVSPLARMSPSMHALWRHSQIDFV